MKPVVCAKSVLVVCLLGAATNPTPAVAQLAEEISVPEPTQLQVVASVSGAAITWSQRIGGVNSSSARADITALEIEGGSGKRARGVQITLQSDTSSDVVYISEDLLLQFRAELQQIETTKGRSRKCDARVRCEMGIARCRPAGTVAQAYCPGHYTTPDGDTGFVFSTPRGKFLFPAVDAAQVDARIGEAITALR